MSREKTPAPVPGESRGRQAGEDPWERHGAERGVWTNRYFEKLGLFSLELAREETMSLRRGATC